MAQTSDIENAFTTFLNESLESTGFSEDVKRIIRSAKPFIDSLSPAMKEKLFEMIRTGGVLIRRVLNF